MITLPQKFGVAAILAAALLMNTHTASAQHSDIDFEYHDGMIEVEFGSEGRVFESDFPTSGGFAQFTDDPGFGTHDPVNQGDIIDYNILGPLEYHNGTSFAPVPAGAKIIIGDNPSGTLDVDGSTVGPESGPGFIGQADIDGDVHTHINFTLDPPALSTPEYGAYGLLMELTTDAPGIANSESFYIVFNFGLEEDEMEPGPHFHDAVEAFAAKIPEPTSLALIGTAAGLFGLAMRRRKE